MAFSQKMIKVRCGAKGSSWFFQTEITNRKIIGLRWNAITGNWGGLISLKPSEETDRTPRTKRPADPDASAIDVAYRIVANKIEKSAAELEVANEMKARVASEGPLKAIHTFQVFNGSTHMWEDATREVVVHEVRGRSAFYLSEHGVLCRTHINSITLC